MSVTTDGKSRGLSERWIAFRNRTIANPSFQRWAAQFPLVRIIARRRSRALFDICAGFVYSQILLACVRLKLFEILAAGPRSCASLAPTLALTRDATERLLRAAAALGLLRRLPDDRYGLDDLGAAMLGNPSIAAFVEHHAIFYDDLRDPVALLRGEVATGLSRFWPYAENRPGSGGARAPESGEFEDLQAYDHYSRLMALTQALIVEDIVAAYPLRRHILLLDVGGGDGAFVTAAALHAPALRFHLFDLPPVAARATQRLARQGLAQRVAVTGGSFLDDQLPRGADIITLVRIVHDHDDESVLVLLNKVFEALEPGGTLLLAEPMAGEPGAAPVGDAYFGLYFQAMGRGRARTRQEIDVLLRRAGFSRITGLPMPRPVLASGLICRRM